VLKHHARASCAAFYLSIRDLYGSSVADIIWNVKPYISVIIPCFDEMANLQKGVLTKIIHFLEKKGKAYEVIVVDDGSKDGSVEFIEEFAKDHEQVRLIKNPHMGKAGAVTTGMLSATGEYLLFTDMDQATPIEEIDTLLPFFSKGYDIVIGSRNSTRRGSPFIRVFISRANILLRKIIVGVRGITDTQCGFKMFRRDTAQTLFGKVKKIHHGFHKISGSSVSSGFDVELLYIAEKMGYTIKEVPVHWLYVETRRVNPVKDSVQGLAELIRIKQNDRKGLYAS
jgi:dolichyl-phosphate beta-glucosyltransferase